MATPRARTIIGILLNKRQGGSYKGNTIEHSSIYLQEQSRDKFRDYGHLESHMRKIMEDLMIGESLLKILIPNS